jgi:hypothetical protein
MRLCWKRIWSGRGKKDSLKGAMSWVVLSYQTSQFMPSKQWQKRGPEESCVESDICAIAFHSSMRFFMRVNALLQVRRGVMFQGDCFGRMRYQRTRFDEGELTRGSCLCLYVNECLCAVYVYVCSLCISRDCCSTMSQRKEVEAAQASGGALVMLLTKRKERPSLLD